MEIYIILNVVEQDIYNLILNEKNGDSKTSYGYFDKGTISNR